MKEESYYCLQPIWQEEGGQIRWKDVHRTYLERQNNSRKKTESEELAKRSRKKETAEM